MKKIYLIILILLTFITINCNYSDVSFAKKKKTSGVEIIEYESTDGFNIKGKLYLPKLKKGEKAPLVVLIHSLGKDRHSWMDLPDLMKEKKYACLVIDLRGHGKSIYNKNLRKRSWNYFTYKDFRKFPDDIITAVEYIETVYHKKIDTSKIMLVGSDIGASTAIISAAKLNKKSPKVLSMALISPTIKMKGLFTPIELVNYGAHPTLVFVSKTHKESYHDTYELKKYAQGDFTIISFSRGGIGALLYKEKPIIKDTIVKWALKTFNPQENKTIELKSKSYY